LLLAKIGKLSSIGCARLGNPEWNIGYQINPEIKPVFLNKVVGCGHGLELGSVIKTQFME